MNFSEMYDAITEAQRTIELAETQSTRMARILQGRLRMVQPWVLVNLKRELRDFNIHTKEWKGGGE